MKRFDGPKMRADYHRCDVRFPPLFNPATRS